MTREEAIANLKMSDKYCLVPSGEAIKMAIKSLEQESKTGWISVSKRLPEEAVLACDMYGCMIVGIIYEDEDSAETGYTAEDDGCLMNDVVAWQPLPKSYKGDR